MKNIKKILCLVLALTMCLSLVNLSALADEATYHCNGCNKDYTIGELVVLRDIPAKDCKDKDGQELGCPECGYTLTNTNDGNRGPHIWGGWEKSENGTHTRKCSVCGETESESHNWKHETQPATCFEKGNEYDVCTVCGAQDNNKSSDTLTADFTKYADNHDGTHTVYCWKCDGKADGHSYTVKCEDKDNDGKCDMCGAELKKECDHRAGNHEDLSQYKAPTCTEKGQHVYVCNECGGVVDNKEIDPLGHDLMHCSGKDATCTEAGTKESWVCNRVVDGKLCGAHFTDAEGKNPVNGKDDLTIPALGHEWGPWTHTEDSLKHFRYCKRDNCDCEYNVYPVTGVHNNWEYFTKDPTCTEDGYTEKKCPDCGYTETTVIPAKGHQTKIIVDNEPTCIEKGNEHEVCTVCGVTVENKENPALGHEWGSWQSDGAKGHYQVCDRCESHSDTVDHRFGAWETVTEATTTEEGQEKRVCEDCGHTETRTTSKIEVDNPGNQGGNNTPTRYTLTINYQYADGTKAAEQYSGKFDRNAPYSVTSPEIEGYTPDVTQVIGNMTGNLTVTVTYNANEVNIDEDDPPLVDNPEDKDPIDSDPSETDLPDEQPPLTDLPDEQPPLTDLPDEQPPLTDLPTEWPPLEEVSDEQTPLAELPDELVPTTDITDDDVPLASAPQTGDISLVWYAAAAVSTMGLAVLTLKKREDEEN